MTDLLKRSSIEDRWVAYQAAAIVAYVLLVLTSAIPIEVGAALAATLVLIASRFLGSWQDPEDTTVVSALVAAVLLLGVGLVIGPWRPYILVTTLFVLPLALGAGYVAWRGRPDDRGVRWVATGLLAAIVLVIAVLWIPAADPPWADMLFLHESAAEVMLDLRNPYADAYSVSTNPFAPEGAEYVGYAYPPLTMIAFAGSHIAFGDSRWAGVIAMLLVVVLITRPWKAMTRHHAAALIALGLAFVVQPWLGTVLWFGWTDPVALPLLLGAGLLWRRHPALSAVLLGLAFGTKQYFVIALPLLLAWSDAYRWKRTVIASGVAALTVLPAVLLDPVAFWSATIALAFSAPGRLDSSGLAGVGLDLPFWVMIVVSVGIAAWMGRAGGGSARFLLALAATLSVAFLLGFQAFMNYWYAVGALAVFSMVTMQSRDLPPAPDTPTASSPSVGLRRCS